MPVKSAHTIDPNAKPLPLTPEHFLKCLADKHTGPASLAMAVDAQARKLRRCRTSVVEGCHPDP
jgi:hypothetical protein